MKICVRMVWLLVAIALVSIGGEHAFAQAQSRSPINIRTLSSRPDLVSGGDTLLAVSVPAGTSGDRLTVTLNGTDVMPLLGLDAASGEYRGVIDGLVAG